MYTRETLQAVADQDVGEVWMKDLSYGQSWKKRGGVGAFMMLARKWDRLDEFCRRCAAAWDIFAVIIHTKDVQGADGTALAEIRDLRRYLLLVEAEMIAQKVVPHPGAAQSILRTLEGPSECAGFPGHVEHPFPAPGHDIRVAGQAMELLDAGVSDGAGTKRIVETGPRGFDPALDTPPGADQRVRRPVVER